MARTVHARLDDSAENDLRTVKNEGLSDSAALRTALREAADRRRARSRLRVEAERLAADESDLEEAGTILEHLAELAPPEDLH